VLNSLLGLMLNLDMRASLFWFGVLLLISLRLILSSDLAVHVIYSPHDDSLYVERAYRLLQGQGFGSYDSRTLIKYPGISIWLAAMREMYVPFLFSVNALYIAAGLYMATALLRGGAAYWTVFAALALYFLNPITFGYEWLRVMREPLGTGLFVLILAAMAHILVSLERGSQPWPHTIVLAPTFAFALFLREDDQLMWALLFLFAVSLAWQFARRASNSRDIAVIFVAVLLPAGVAKVYEFALRDFVARHYGLPILHELGEAEFPRLLATIRSIHSAKDNRLVMVTQEALEKLQREVPSLNPVIQRLPPPGPTTFSCRIHGVCSEWANGWMPFWIRDQAHNAGMTPSLIEGQDYYREVREAIALACASGRLECTPKGDSLIPPMEIRWTRAYIAEAWRLAKMAVAPDPNTVATPTAADNVSRDLTRMFGEVTMSHRFAINASTGPTRFNGGTWRVAIAKPYRVAAAILLMAALIFLAVRLWVADRRAPGALALIGIIFGLYCLIRLAALSYVAVYMGPFDPRMVFSIYAAAVLLALPFIAETIIATGYAA
jgi:hypothetical protein